MNSKIPETNEQWEEFFQQAADDFGEYLSRLKNGAESQEGENRLADLLVARGRARSAVRVLKANSPEEYQEDSERIFRLWERSEAKLQAEMRQNINGLEKNASKILQSLEGLETMLRSVRKIDEDRNLLTDSEGNETENSLSLREDHREIAQDFLHGFNRIHYIANEMNRLPFEKLTESKAIQDKIADLESQFRKNFQSFHPISNVLPRIFEREYFVDHLWLSNLPTSDATEKTGWVEKLMEAYRPSLGKQAVEECDFSDETIQFALGEIAPQRRKEIKEHLADCAACMDLFFDVKMAENAVAQEPDESVSIPLPLKKAMEKKTAASANKGGSIIEKFGRKISGFFEDFFSTVSNPKLVAGMAACCLVLAMGINLYWEQATLDVSMQVMARPGITRGKGDGPASPRTVQEGDTVATGEQFQIQIQTDGDGYGYVILYGDSGRVQKLFEGNITKNDTITVPSKNNWIELDFWRGSETIYLIAGPDRIDNFDQRLAELKDGGDERISELFKGFEIETISFVHQ